MLAEDRSLSSVAAHESGFGTFLKTHSHSWKGTLVERRPPHPAFPAWKGELSSPTTFLHTWL